jgi:hypothetical protein
MGQFRKSTGSGFRNTDSIAVRAGNFSFHIVLQTGSGAYSGCSPIESGSYLPKDNLSYITHLRLMLRLRMCGTLPLFCVLDH